MDKIPASVGILTCNSEKTLRRALESVSDFEDIVICDGGSTDTTIALAEEYGARVISQDAQYKNKEGALTDFGAARNQCLNAARFNWFLYVDSDESISTGLRDDIARIVQQKNGPLVYRVPIGIMLNNTFLQYSSNYPGYQYRFFNRQSGAYFIKPVHERITFPPSVPVGTLTHPWFIHTTRKDWEQYLEDGRRYRDIAVAKFKKDSWGRVIQIVLRNVRAALGVFLRASWIYLVHGSSRAVPFPGERGRFLDPLILSVRIIRAKCFPKGECSDSERWVYAAYMRMPTERAHGVQVVATCAALTRAGKTIELIVPTRTNHLSTEDPFSYYKITPQFPITFLPTPDLVRFGAFGFILSIAMFARSLKRYVKNNPASVIFSRDERVLHHMRHEKAMLIWESHTGSWNAVAKKVARRVDKIFVITQGLKDFYRDHGVPEEKITVVPDGVQLSAFPGRETKTAARQRLGLDEKASIAMYVGKLDGWKGVSTFLNASTHTHALCVVIGGEPEEVSRLSKEYPQVRFLGTRPYGELPENLAAADVLILPNTARDPVSTRFTSPLKLFAYMGAQRAIIASDLPSLREVLDDSMAYFVMPDDPRALARAIDEALTHPSEAALKVAHAAKRVQEYSWDARAQAILNA